MLTKKNRLRLAKAWGFVLEEDALKGMQKGRQEGRQEGMLEILSRLESGVPLAEVKRELQFA